MQVGRRQPDESGFTLIELLISTVILGLLGSAVAACIILFFRTADGTSRRFAYSHDSQLLATYLVPDLDSLAGDSPGLPNIAWVAAPPPGCPAGSASFSDLQITFKDVDSGKNYVAHYKVTAGPPGAPSAVTRGFTVNGATTSPDLDMVHTLKQPYLACFSTRPSAPWTMTVTTGPPSAANTSDDYTFSVTAGGRVTYPPPSNPTLTPPSPGNITNINTPTLTGTATPGDTVTLLDGGTTVGTGVADGGRKYSIKVTTLVDGSHTITATATDATGNTSAPSGSTIVIIDTVEAQPSQPVLSPAGGNITNVSTPSFTGTAENNSTSATVSLFEGPTLVGSGTSNGGTYTATINAPLVDGNHTITARTTDAAGNTSPYSQGLKVILNTAATMPTIDPIVNGSSTATGALGTFPGSSATANFAIYSGTAISGTMAGQTTVVTNGNPWKVTWTGLTPGMRYTLVVTQTDTAGNVASAKQTFTQ